MSDGPHIVASGAMTEEMIKVLQRQIDLPVLPSDKYIMLVDEHGRWALAKVEP